ncbi:dCTP deaminase [Rhodospirillum rubrum]|uniref:dCTP deaminase n=1 Tax=Rhodospirillum rubrum (strain ATCC 11170 / ATH 1.1.1 / DSM 467 / LMG 4362 / NCIMB 8255 / S1) TaxID=269796 RepID=DCD_RHORT|nr:dCTP deaminase [Rhodospirillum rubrum]Q2RQK4.1 RecName: Full=dCTP deaminase; AltName: Full=Deoxycytidine triphosphate deaminase [Rhodospirillum rubrum ATCC 11170]ABC23591.1 dCTP deaminase [Rhodospirillum rubrum ATCC 11170]AEO49329.1 dCTP deaminase [Rhodospirillum rubrum F11]MBK1663902.1 dCTP deaminase [Rhodospirillum rubrum]MBK1678246.1 dCTP deaminase [Rhodospirillum rubrum]MBK5955266.1 dCTP deaminase [Rhodospirillum rubrum]
MKLSDTDIRRYMAEGRIAIDPVPGEDAIGAMSVDLQLGDSFRVFVPGKVSHVDLAPPGGIKGRDIEALMGHVEVGENEAFYLHPGEFALGITIQRVRLPADVAGRLDGRSSLARLGLMVHATAHTIDPGWDGRITLEFFNCGPLPLAMRPGMRICAISFEALMSPTSKPYAASPTAKYKDQLAPLPSRLASDQSA